MGTTTILHKNGLDPKLAYFMDHNDDVVTEDLAKSLVHHRRVAFASQGVSKLLLNHREGRFDVRAPVVAGHKFLAPRAEVLEHLVPRARNPVLGLAIGLEGDEGGRPGLGDGVDVPVAEVSLIRRDFLYRKVLSGRVQQRREKWSIVLLAVRDLGSGNDIGLSAAHQVSLEPFPLGFGFPPLVLHPAVEAGSAEARSIDGEGSLNRRQRQGRFGDESLEGFGQLRLLEDVEDAVVVGEPSR